MILRLLALLAIVLLLAAVPRPSWSSDGPSDLDDGLRLLEQGDTLAERGAIREAIVHYKDGFEKILPGLRRLEFRQDVEGNVTPREQLREVLQRELDEDMTPEELRAQELGLRALGFLPEDFDLKETLLQMLAEEVAAYYDTKTKAIYMVEEGPAEDRPPPTFLERLLGQTGGFDKDEAKMAIAHELTHALADQHFDLEALLDAAKGDEDMTLAILALVEGEATLTMIAAAIEDWHGDDVTQLPARRLGFFINLASPFLARLSGPALRQAPPLLAEWMISPYMRGVVFCAHLTNQGGWEAIDQAYRQPPLSTEQILHPEKYRDDPDPPTAIDLGTLEPGDGWTEAGRNVVGELQLGVLLRRHGGRAVAAGWDGDAYAVFEGPDDRLGLVWLSTWDSEDDARTFARQYARFQTTKLGPDIPEPGAFPDALRRPHQGAIHAVERRGRDVAVVEGFSPETTATLIAAAFDAEKREKTLDLAPAGVAEAEAD